MAHAPPSLWIEPPTAYYDSCNCKVLRRRIVEIERCLFPRLRKVKNIYKLPGGVRSAARFLLAHVCCSAQVKNDRKVGYISGHCVYNLNYTDYKVSTRKLWCRLSVGRVRVWRIPVNGVHAYFWTSAVGSVQNQVKINCFDRIRSLVSLPWYSKSANLCRRFLRIIVERCVMVHLKSRTTV